MQSEDESLIEFEIQQVLKELDGNEILSKEERIELKDHFLCEVEDLTKLGLRDKEALLVAKKRFGVLEDVEEEYKKVKSSLDWMRYGIIGVVVFCLIKILIILLNTFSEIFWIVYHLADPKFVENYILLDIPLRFILILIIGFITSKIINRMNFKNLASLWKFPIFYLFSELFRRLFTFYVLPISTFHEDLYLTMAFFSNTNLVSYSLLLLMMIIATIKLYKMKVMDMEYV